MAVKPMIFSGPMVKAILDGDKTMTRRVIKPQPKSKLTYVYAAGHKRYIGKWTYPSRYEIEQDGIWTPPEGFTAADRDALWTPPCHGDDILWARESWAKINGSFVYRADDNAVAFFKRAGIAVKWRPSIHMPKEAARIFLRVTKVSVKRVQDISDSDAIDEGMLSYHGWETPEYLAAVEKTKRDGTEPPLGFTPRERFAHIWDSLRKPADLKQYGWDANPWVWVISFEHCEKPEAW